MAEIGSHDTIQREWAGASGSHQNSYPRVIQVVELFQDCLDLSPLSFRHPNDISKDRQFHFLTVDIYPRHHQVILMCLVSNST